MPCRVDGRWVLRTAGRATLVTLFTSPLVVAALMNNFLAWQLVQLLPPNALKTNHARLWNTSWHIAVRLFIERTYEDSKNQYSRMELKSRPLESAAHQLNFFLSEDLSRFSPLCAVIHIRLRSRSLLCFRQS